VASRGPPGAGKPMVSLARARVSSHAKPAAGVASPKAGLSAARTDSSVHMPSGEPCPPARNTARILGGSSTATTPPWTTNTSPLIGSAAGPARYTTNGATCSGASGSTAPSGAGPISPAVIAVRARGQMALARTP
jgi:hypothetical protein